jgi:hypothetical protein
MPAAKSGEALLFVSTMKLEARIVAKHVGLGFL